MTEEELLAKVRELNEDNDVDGFIVQLPLPKHISEQKVIETIDYRKDVDGFHPVSYTHLTLTGKASTKIVLESDSLIKVLETLPYDTTRLNVLNQIIRIEQNNQQCIQYSDALMKEALQLGNDK